MKKLEIAGLITAGLIAVVAGLFAGSIFLVHKFFGLVFAVPKMIFALPKSIWCGIWNSLRAVPRAFQTPQDCFASILAVVLALSGAGFGYTQCVVSIPVGTVGLLSPLLSGSNQKLQMLSPGLHSKPPFATVGLL